MRYILRLEEAESDRKTRERWIVFFRELDVIGTAREGLALKRS